MQQESVVWLPDDVRMKCGSEGDLKFPLESGGAFMGYWPNEHCAVVTEVIGPGPNATHEPFHFEPDYEWQLAEIAKHYEKSGRRETYLGDWHTHPADPRGKLSSADRRVIRQIINTSEARCSKPIMAIFHGEKSKWDTKIWLGELHNRPFIWPRLVTHQMVICTFRA